MNYAWRVIWTTPQIVLFFAASFYCGSVSGDDDPLLIKSRALTAQYAMELQIALKDAMTNGGPINAISVCKTLAPQIASKLSRFSGASVTRTSLRFRNPGNAPADWQTEVLAKFDAASPDSGPQEFFERTGNNGARYMKAIPTGSICLTCHGTDLDPEIQQQLEQDYPHDKARGYALGDVRGAFSVAWPLDVSM